MNLNKVTLIGRVGQIFPSKNQEFYNLAIVTCENWFDKTKQDWVEDTEWHKVCIFSPKNVEKSKKLVKGERVYIEGKIKTSKWKDKNNVEKEVKEIHAFLISSMSSKEEKEKLLEKHGNPTENNHVPPAAQKKTFEATFEDDIPF